jgi:hypothetical protein
MRAGLSLARREPQRHNRACETDMEINMRFTTRFAGAMTIGLGLWLQTLAAKAGDDLTLPPEFRSPAPVAASEPELQKAPAPKRDTKLQKTPSSKSETKSQKTRPKSDAKLNVPASAGLSEPDAKVEKPSRKSQDEAPVSLDMKWNAANNPNGGPGGSLFDDVSRNVNGATVGTGAEVGFKYKF